jgi:hypothetical protein
MARRYVAIAPIITSSVPLDHPFPIDLGCGVRIDRVPAVYEEHRAVLERRLGEVNTGHRGLALVHEYEAEERFELDPNPPGKPRTKSAAARHALQTASVSLWLARPNDISFCLIAHLSGKIFPVATVFPTLRATGSFEPKALSESDLAEAREINAGLSRIATDVTAYVATRYLWLALHEDNADLAYGILSIAVEALLGPDDHQYIGRRIPQRGASLLGGTREEQCLTHVRLSAWWLTRNAIMHGDTFDPREDAAKDQLLSEVQETVRRCIRIALLDAAASKEFATFPTRDSYLDRIVASFLDPSPSEIATAQKIREDDLERIRVRFYSSSELPDIG